MVASMKTKCLKYKIDINDLHEILGHQNFPVVEMTAKSNGIEVI